MQQKVLLVCKIYLFGIYFSLNNFIYPNKNQINEILPRKFCRIPAKLLRKKNKTCLGFEVRFGSGKERLGIRVRLRIIGCDAAKHTSLPGEEREVAAAAHVVIVVGLAKVEREARASAAKLLAAAAKEAAAVASSSEVAAKASGF